MAGNFSMGTTQTTGPGTATSSQTQKTVAMDPKAIQALGILLTQLQGGGTADQQNDRAARTGAVNKTTQAAQGYTRENAFADAEGAMQAEVNNVLARLLPDILRQAEGSGTSQNSLRALLTQAAGMDAAQGAATIGLRTAVDYGNVNANLMSALSSLTGGNDPVQAAILQALNIAKGASTTTTTNGTANNGSGASGSGMGSSAAYSGGQTLNGLGNVQSQYGVRQSAGGMSYAAPTDGGKYGTGGRQQNGGSSAIANNPDLLSGFKF